MEVQGRKGAPLILVVDDEPHVLSSLADLLRKEFCVAVTSDPDEALKLLAKDDVALLLTDHRMPQVTGAQLLRSCTSISPSTTRVLVTGYSDIEAVVEAVNEGKVYHYVSKPWESERLLEVIRRGVEKYSLEVDGIRLLTEVAGLNEFYHHEVPPIAPSRAGLHEHVREAVHSSGDFVRAIDCLRGVVPICMYCHRVQVDGEGWSSIVELLTSRSRVLSHGVCPSCAGRLEFGEAWEKSVEGA